MKFSFLRSVAKLSTLSIAGQVSSIIALPFITRMFTPDEFGFYSFFVTLVTIIGLLASGMYHKVIMITDEPVEANRLVFLVLLLGFIASSVIFCIIHVVLVFDLFSSSKDILVSLSDTLFLALFFYMGSQGLYLWNNRLRNYNLMGGSSLIRDVVASLSKLAFGYLGILKLGLVYGFLISQFVFFSLLLFSFMKKINFRGAQTRVQFQDYWLLMKKYIDFPKFNLIADFLGTFSIQAPILFMAVLFGATSLGYYALARSVLGIPVTILGASVGAVFQKEASEQFNKNGNFSELYRQTGGGIFLLGVIPVILSMFFMEPIFIIAFGNDWATAGYYGAILSPLYLLRLIGKPLSFAFVLTDHLKFDFYLMLAFVLASLFSLGAGFYFKSAELSVYLISITHSLCYIIYIYFGYQMSTGKTFKTH